MISGRIFLIGMWLQNARGSVSRRVGEQLGQGIMEYAILLGGIALVAGAAFAFGAGGLSFSGMKTQIQDCINFSSSC